ncbi:unnamed protein product [Acanthocheilonema viteae]|uniref:Glutamate synthase domain-containing protein n=1 Tax=Acanthocheilonema viteae TaxID=6277 RepID=A0A498SGQ2_ACAVI|nr:unnamed protein product [Acanthocheilonema viteae]
MPVSWEIEVAETHQVLCMNNLRKRIVLQADVRLELILNELLAFFFLRRDVMIAALIRADEFGMSTAPLIVLGDPILRAKFKGKLKYVANFLFMVAKEMRYFLSKQLMNITGSHMSTYYTQVRVLKKKATMLEFSNILLNAQKRFPNCDIQGSTVEININGLKERIIKAAKDLFSENGRRNGYKLFKIANADRAFGFGISYHISKQLGEMGYRTIFNSCQSRMICTTKFWCIFGKKSLYLEDELMDLMENEVFSQVITSRDRKFSMDNQIAINPVRRKMEMKDSQQEVEENEEENPQISMNQILKIQMAVSLILKIYVLHILKDNNESLNKSRGFMKYHRQAVVYQPAEEQIKTWTEITNYGTDSQIFTYSTGKCIAIIDSGPTAFQLKRQRRTERPQSSFSEMVAAAQLSKMGHAVVIYEKKNYSVIGFILRSNLQYFTCNDLYDIPTMRLDKYVVDRKIKLLEDKSVRFVTNTEIRKYIPSDNDAILICTDSTIPRDLSISNHGVKRFCFMMEFLEESQQIVASEEEDWECQSLDVKGKGIIIQCTAIDCIAIYSMITVVRHILFHYGHEERKEISDDDTRREKKVPRGLCIYAIRFTGSES